MKPILLVTAMSIAALNIFIMFVQSDPHAFPETIQFCMATILLLTVPLIYMFPTHLAWARGHDNTMAIGVLNLFLGWTFIGWVAALIWACTRQMQQLQFQGGWFLGRSRPSTRTHDMTRHDQRDTT